MKKIKAIIGMIGMYLLMMPTVLAVEVEKPLSYVKCGTTNGIPAPMPLMTSIAFTLLIIGTPLVFIAFGIVTLVKAVTAQKEDEIMKARNKLLRKLIAALLVFVVAGFSQFVIKRAADDSEKETITTCLSCFLYNSGCVEDPDALRPDVSPPPGYDPNAVPGRESNSNTNSNSNVAGGQSYKFTQMAICTDGGSDPHGSSTHNPATAYSIGGKYMDPVKVHYVVAPVGYTGVSNGDFAVVIDHNTGKYVYAIVGDRGPKNPTGGYFSEVSLSVAWDLGHTSASGKSGPSGNFETIVFPGTAVQWSSFEALVENLDSYGKRYYPQ